MAARYQRVLETGSTQETVEGQDARTVQVAMMETAMGLQEDLLSRTGQLMGQCSLLDYRFGVL